MQRTLIEQVFVQLSEELTRLECALIRCEEIQSLAVLNRITELRKWISALADVLPTN